MKALRYTLLLLSLLFFAAAAQAMQPAEVLDKAARVINSSGGITATYTMKVGGRSHTGSIAAKGKKFHINMGGIVTWYDGKNQWNLNTAAGEVTLSTPTAAEISSASPLVMVSSYKNTYRLQAVKSAIAGTYAVKLLPKSSTSTVKSAVIYVRKNSFQPCRLDVSSRDGSSSTIVITSLKTGQKLPDSRFVFPKSKYPKVTVVDLR